MVAGLVGEVHDRVMAWLGGLLMAIPGTAPASDTASVELAKVPFFLGREY